MISVTDFKLWFDGLTAGTAVLTQSQLKALKEKVAQLHDPKDDKEAGPAPSLTGRADPPNGPPDFMREMDRINKERAEKERQSRHPFIMPHFPMGEPDKYTLGANPREDVKVTFFDTVEDLIDALKPR